MYAWIILIQGFASEHCPYLPRNKQNMHHTSRINPESDKNAGAVSGSRNIHDAFIMSERQRNSWLPFILDERRAQRVPRHGRPCVCRSGVHVKTFKDALIMQMCMIMFRLGAWYDDVL